MKYDTENLSDALPAVVHAQNMRKAPRKHFTADGLPVVPHAFDHALNIPVLPDHLISSMISYVLKACFKALSTNELRAQVEMRIIEAANTNGLEVKGRLLIWERSKGRSEMTFKGLASNSMSSWFAILVVAAPIFKHVAQRTYLTMHSLPDKLQSLVQILYRWPKRTVEGRKCRAWDFSSVEHQLLYQHTVTDLCVRFLKAARQEYVHDRDLGTILDKPITHRLLELVMTTIPSYGHARLCSELVLEHAHQQFKKWLVSNTHANAHITAMEKAICRDWLWRLSSLHSLWKDAQGESKLRAEVGLRRLVFGEVGVSANMMSSTGQNVLAEMREALVTAMQSPVQEILEESLESNDSWTRRAAYCWSAYRRVRDETYKEEFSDLIDVIVRSERASGETDTSPSDFDLCTRVRYILDNANGRRRSYKYNVLEPGAAFSAVVTRHRDEDAENRLIETVLDGDGDRRFFAVFAIIRRTPSGAVWVIVKEMVRCVQETLTGYSCEGQEYRVLRLDDSCRRIAAIHMCTQSCVRRGGWGSPVHDTKLMEGGKYMMVSRSEGYPPFLG